MKILGWMLLFFSMPGFLVGAPVYIDSTFGPHGNGTIVTAYGDDDEAMDVVTYPTGEILIVGNSLQNKVYSITATRYLPSGVIDTTFGNQGLSQFSAVDGLTVNSVLDFGEKYLVMGSVMMGVEPHVGGAQFLKNGSVDTAFGADGLAYNPAYGIAENAAEQNGKLILLVNAGIVGNEQLGMYIIRLNSDTSIDTTFAGDGTGIRKMPIQNISSIYGHSLHVGSDYILVSGYVNEYSGEKIFVAKFTAEGLVDNSFGGTGTGYVVTAFPNSVQAHSHFMGLQSDGKVIVGGSAGCDFVLVRYTAAGILDTTFGIQGITRTSIGDCAHGYAGAVVADDKIVLAGLSDDAIAVARYNANGVLDTTFGNGGIATMPVGDNSVAQAFAVQSDGKIVVVGSSANKFAVARFRANKDDFISILSPADGSTITASTFALNGNASESEKNVRIKVDGTVVATTTTDAYGNWNAGTSIIIADGSHTLLAELMDGETVVTSDSHSVTVAASTDSCVIVSPASGGTVTSQTPTISGRASHPSASVKVSVDSALIGTVTTDALGAWSVASSRLANGSHTILAQLMDGETVLASDTKSCTVSVTLYISFDTPSVGSTITSSTTNIDGKCSEATKTLHVIVDGVAFKKITSTATGTWDAGTSNTLANGDHVIQVYGVDASGTAQMYASNYFTVNA